MRKSLLAIALLIFTISKINAQAVHWALLQDICPPTSWGGASAPSITSDGDDLISFGRISNSITLGNQIMNGNNGKSSYLAKHDQNGNLLWAKHLVGTGYELIVTTDINKNIIVAGSYRDSLVIGNLIFTNPGSQGGLFIAKFNPSGNLLWSRSTNPGAFSYHYTLTTDGSGNVYVAGEYQNSLTIGTTSITSLGWEDIFLVKYDPSGNFQWLNNIGTVGPDRNPSLIGGINNDVFLASNSRTTGYTTQPGQNGYFLRKFNNTGTQLWSKFVYRRSVYYQTYLSRDASENVYIAGMQDTTLTFDNHTVNFTGTDFKTFLAKVNTSGTWKWAKQIPFTQNAVSYVNMANEKKNELNIIRSTDSWPTNNIQVAKLDTSGTIIKSHNFITGAPGTTTQTNFYFISNASTDNAGNTYISGGVAGNNTLGTINLNAPPAILGPALANPSAGFIAKILENANTVTGNLFIDVNGNGVKDANEQPFENGIVEFTPGPGYVTSAANGSYSLYFPSGNFSLQVAQPANHYTFLPQNHSVSFSGIGQTQTKDFALQPIPNRNDVKVTVTNLTPARPGFKLKYRITFENVGTTTLSDSLKLNYAAGSLTFDSANTSPVVQQAGKLRWLYQNLQPTQKRNIDVNFTVSTTTPINTQLTALANIAPLSTDFIPSNNQDTLHHNVTGSFDPNDKQVSRTWLTPQQVADSPLLDYVIRFQNTGNDTAFTVIVRDSISNKLHMPSFELLSASHPYTFKLLENGMAEWRFDNILLPDSNRNEPASHGFIRYRMQAKNNLVLGDEIKSRAAIYFDYNSPVHTNYAVTRISLTNGIKERITKIQAFKLYPNPAKNYVMVAAEFKKNTSATVSLVNLLGQTLSKVTLPANNHIHYQMPLNELPKGVYLIRLETETGMQTQRLVIQ